MVHFFTLPYCQVFNVSMYSIIISNGSTHLDWSDLITTIINPDERFMLDKFNLTIEGNDLFQKQDIGLAKVEWKHSHQCIKKYMLRLSHSDIIKGGEIGENVLLSPLHLGEAVEQDLQMIPGE